MLESPPSLALVGVRETTSLLEINYLLGRPESAIYAPELFPLMASFVRVAVNGGFPLRDVGGVSTILLRSYSELVSQTTIRDVLEVRNLDWRAFQLIRSMVARLRSEKIFVQSITVLDPMTSPTNTIYLDWPDEINETDVYPALIRRAETLLTLSDIDFSKSRRLMVVVDGPLTPKEVIGISAWVEPWYWLLEYNSFSMPIAHPANACSIAGSVSQFDDVTIEISVDRFMATESAWNILINMICAFGWSPRSLVGLVIE
jgi:hypothetical protein